MTFFRYVIVLVAVYISFIMPASSLAGYDYIDINSPSLRKIPISVPLLGTDTGNETGMQLSRKASDMLSGMLDFTGYFKMLDRDSFIEDPAKTKSDISNIHFPNWTAVGAELLVAGNLQVKGGVLEIELRLFDTIKAGQLIGKKYSAGINDLRDVIKRFSAEIIYYLTGNRGVFDSQIAFVSSGTGNKEIYMCEFDGSDIKIGRAHV